MNTILKNIFLLGFITLALSACSTMNKSECVTADWRTIGFGDGANGQPASRISQHRSACAEYGITPDLNAYNAGRNQGLAQYCIPPKGYSKGLSGSGYNGVCKGHNEKAFLEAYNYGMAVHKEEVSLSRMKRDYSNTEYNIHSLEKNYSRNERKITSGKLSELKTYKLLQRNKEISEEIGRSKSNLASLSNAISDQQHRIDNLKRGGRYN